MHFETSVISLEKAVYSSVFREIAPLQVIAADRTLLLFDVEFMVKRGSWRVRSLTFPFPS
jgi:hypothetical protein